MATLINLADVLCCQEKIGFYLTAQDSAVTDEMLETLGITPVQFEGIRADLPDKLADAESTLSG